MTYYLGEQPIESLEDDCNCNYPKPRHDALEKFSFLKYLYIAIKELIESPHITIIRKVGNENKRNAKRPPQKEAVAYIDTAINTCVDVGPGID